MRGIISGILLILLIWISAGCLNNNQQAEQIVRRVKIEEVQLADSIDISTFSGIVRENSGINLAFRVAGPIAEVHVGEGDFVQSGQVVALMDKRDYQIQLDAALAHYEQVKAEADRVIELYNRESISRNDYDKAVSGLKMVEAKLNHAREQLNDTKLTSPVSGYVHRLNFKRGELIDAGMPMAEIIDVSQYLVETDIPVSLYAGRDNIISFTGIQPVLENDPFPLTFLNIARKASHNQLYRVQLLLDPSRQPELAPGMDVKVRITSLKDGEQEACIPLTALCKSDGDTFVFVYDPASQRVVRREVSPGRLTGDGRIIIESGVVKGEQIVVAGVSLINPNDLVKPVEDVSETNVGGVL